MNLALHRADGATRITVAVIRSSEIMCLRESEVLVVDGF